MRKTCPWCNQDFTPSREWQDFCCTKHQQAWHRHQRKLGDVQAAEAARANGRPKAAREIVNGHIERLEEAMHSHEVQAQAAEPFRRRL
jgi:hypothetical protein